MGMICNSGPILHQNFVEHIAIDTVPINQRVVIALSGPLISLFQGLLAGIAFAKIKPAGLFRLFILWLSALGFTNFFGYLMTGPIFQNGDIGKVYLLLEIPLIYQILIALVGTGILVFIAYKLTRPFLSFCHKSEWLEIPRDRVRFAFAILIIPWVVGSVIMTILYLPVVAVVSIIYPFFSGMIFIFPWQNARRAVMMVPSRYTLPRKVSLSVVMILIVLVAIYKFVLTPGIAL